MLDLVPSLDLHPCARCAQVQKTCCQRAEILVTSADRARIASHSGRTDFFEDRAPGDPDYTAYDAEDPNWARLTVRSDGTRRMLKRQPNGDCTFLGAAGCELPTEVRPIVCRLYPYAYVESGITGVESEYCPTQMLAPDGRPMTEVLDIPLSDARRWHAALYRELHDDHDQQRAMDQRDLLIGLTYDLRDDYKGLGLSEEELAEFDRVDTIERLEGALRELGHRTDRIGNVQALATRLTAGDRWDLVFNIAEGRFGSGREAQVPALLDAYSIPYTFSDPLACALTLHKAATKHVLRDQGIPTPRFAVVATAADVDGVDLTYPLFAKPVAEGTSKGIDAHSVIHSPEELRARCLLLLERHRQPVLVEEYLPGRELTIGVIGTGAKAHAVGALEVHLLEGADAGVYTYRNKEECETLVRYELVHDDLATASSALAVRTWRALDCRDGGRVDVRCDAQGRPQVMEVNPLPGMHPEHSDLPILWHQGGRQFVHLVGAIVNSACERLGAERVVAQPRTKLAPVAAPSTAPELAAEPADEAGAEPTHHTGATRSEQRTEQRTVPSLGDVAARLGRQPRSSGPAPKAATSTQRSADRPKASATKRGGSARPAAKAAAATKPSSKPAPRAGVPAKSTSKPKATAKTATAPGSKSGSKTSSKAAAPAKRAAAASNTRAAKAPAKVGARRAAKPGAATNALSKSKTAPKSKSPTKATAPSKSAAKAKVLEPAARRAQAKASAKPAAKVAAKALAKAVAKSTSKPAARTGAKSAAKSRSAKSRPAKSKRA